MNKETPKSRTFKFIEAFAVVGVMAGLLLGLASPASAQSVSPSSAGERAKAVVETAKEVDGESFAKTLRILESSPHITEYLRAYPEYDRGEQRQIMAAQFTPEAAQAFVLLLERGEITISPERGPGGEPMPRVETPGVDASDKSGNASIQWTGPQCPSAWAALYAWAATETAFCGALGLIGPGAALTCFIVMTGLGSIPDINAGC